MAGPFRFPVFFESPSLNEGQKKKIETYFQVRRKSGGGDCGAVTEISDGVYRIDFRKEGDQQRVLEKLKHEVKFDTGSVELTVRSEPVARPQPKSPIQDFNLPAQSQPSSIASSLQASVGEHELHLDQYLLRYLKENPKASRQLEEELNSVFCSAKIFPNEGKVKCTQLAKSGGAYDFGTWKAEVDKVFAGYASHYEFEPFKVKTLRQSCSSLLTIDDLKVYSEIGMAVVVGKCLQVDAMLKDVEDLYNQQGRALVKRQNSMHRLGKVKLSLLWEEIEQTLGRQYPEVKVTRVDADQINLDGTLEEVVKAGDLISIMEKTVLERTVSGVSPRLLAFLRKAYADPGNLGAFLGISDEVRIDLKDAELRMFSRSAAKLEDTEKEVHRKFKEDTFLIPNCSTVPLELREMLRFKKIEINRGGYRAQVAFGADNNLFLLGHRDEFEELSEVIHQFILDQAGVEGRVILPFPELARELEELLRLHNFDHSGVTIHHLTSSSDPVVVLQGPAGRVTEVRNRLGPFLDSVVQDRVTIDMPGSGRFLESSSGKESISNVARAQKCLIQLPEQLCSFRQDFASGIVATYSLPNGLKVLVCKGDITKQEADALVNAANERLQHGGGVAAALSKAGGPKVQKESNSLVKQRGKIPTGEAVCTTGGNLKCKVLLHAVGPVGGNAGGKERELLERTVKSTLDLAELMMLRSIAMPCISSGLFGIPITVCSEAIVSAVNKFCSLEGRSLSRIILIDNREEVVRAMQEACNRLLQGFTVDERADDGEFQRSESAQDGARGAAAGIPGDGVQVEIIQGTIENQQVLFSQAFQSAQQQVHPRGFSNNVNPHQGKANQKLEKWQNKMNRPSTASANQENQTLLSFKPPPAVLSVIHCGGPGTIQTIKKELEGSLQKQLVERELDVLDFSRLEPMELEAVQCKVRAFGISLEHQSRQRPEGSAGNRAGNAARAGARGREGSGNVYLLKGLKEDVLSVNELVNRAITEALYEDLQEKDEAMLALHVQWSIREENGAWEEFSLHDNFLLEDARSNKLVSVEITALNGKTILVNLIKEEGTDWTTGSTYRVKRIESEAGLTLPEDWEQMGDDLFKKVELQPTSQEYKTVAQGFKQTAKYNICKIERVQNVYLWKAFSVCRERILAKNGSAELGEKFLYHGTNAGACECIERDKFDRGYAGRHAAMFGKGVYFAVNAKYSADRYSPPDSTGLKRLYVARVLTGRYTKGVSSYAAPPPRASDPTDRYDSVVDNPQAPSMFVIFHDDQAYPEYLVTFK